MHGSEYKFILESCAFPGSETLYLWHDSHIGTTGCHFTGGHTMFAHTIAPATRTAEARAAIRFLAAYTRTLRTMAGESFDWQDGAGRVIGGYQAGLSAKYGNARNGYRVIVWERQGGVCSTCGDAMSLGDFDVAHFVGNGGSAGKNGGYVDHNVMGCHTWCNLLDAEEWGEVIPARALAHPEHLMHSTPTRSECLDADARSIAEESRTMAAHRVARVARIRALMADDEA